MQKIEENLETMIKLQKDAQAEMKADIQDLKGHQVGTTATVTAVVEALKETRTQMAVDKKDTDDKLRRFRESLILLDEAMDKPTPNTNSELPRQKIPRSTLPPEDNNMNVENDNNDDDSSATKNPNKNTAPRSDDEMTVAAGGN
jgi:hypothetical protein